LCSPLDFGGLSHTYPQFRNNVRNGFLFRPDVLYCNHDPRLQPIGFDRNLIEVMYNLVDENTANVFHAMRCRKEYREKLRKRGYYAYFN